MPTKRKKRTRQRTNYPLLDLVRIKLMFGVEAERKAVMDEIENPGPRKLSGRYEAFQMRKPCGGHPKDTLTKDRFPLAFEAWQRHKTEIWNLWKHEGHRGKPWGAHCFGD